jgi:hypothetical protein
MPRPSTRPKNFEKIQQEPEMGTAQDKRRSRSSDELTNTTIPTPGGAVAAGDIGPAAVPEPSKGLMALFDTGCVGVAVWRKRRPRLAR